MTWRIWWVIIITALVAELILMMFMATHAQAKPKNERRWINMARLCETKGIKNRWKYGPAHPYAKRHGWSGYYGGLQFDKSTWESVLRPKRLKRWPLAHKAPRWQQILAAEKLRRRRGLQPWPSCGWAWRP